MGDDTTRLLGRDGLVADRVELHPDGSPSFTCPPMTSCYFQSPRTRYGRRHRAATIISNWVACSS